MTAGRKCYAPMSDSHREAIRVALAASKARPNWRALNIERAKAILAMRDAGHTFDAIALAHGISRERARQIAYAEEAKRAWKPESHEFPGLPIPDTRIAGRVQRILTNSNVRSVDDLVELGPHRCRALKEIGEAAYFEIAVALMKLGAATWPMHI